MWVDCSVQYMIRKDKFNNKNTNTQQSTTDWHAKPVQNTLCKNYIRRKCPKEE